MRKGIWYQLLIPLLILTIRSLVEIVVGMTYEPEMDGSSIKAWKSDNINYRRDIMEIYSQEPKNKTSPAKENGIFHPSPLLPRNEQNSTYKEKESSKGRIDRQDMVSRTPYHSKYFPWEDDKPVNYTEICSRILSTLSTFQGPIIVNGGYRGGLGHVSVSFYYSLTYALLLKRPFYLHLKPIFWKHTNNCFQSLQFQGNISALRYCDRSSTCFKSRRKVSTLTKEPVLIQDLRIDGVSLFSDQHLRVLRRFFWGIVEIKDWKDYKRLVFRLFTNPSQELISVIVENRKKLGRYQDLIGAHVRCGGELADSKEGVYWINRNELTRVPFTFRKAIRKLKLKPKKLTVYLATDSSAAEEYLRRILNLKVISYDSSKRGHTTSTTDDSVYQRAIIDMYLVSQASVIIYTHVSGFSEVVLSIAKTKTVFILPFTKRMPVWSVYFE